MSLNYRLVFVPIELAGTTDFVDWLMHLGDRLVCVFVAIKGNRADLDRVVLSLKRLTLLSLHLIDQRWTKSAGFERSRCHLS